MARRGLEIGPLALNLIVPGICIGTGIGHQYLAVRPEFKGPKVRLRMPHTALRGLDGHNYAIVRPTVPEAVESGIRVAGGLVCRRDNSKMLQEVLIRKVVPAAGVAEAGVSSVRITVVQIIVYHPLQLVQALLREKVFTAVSDGNLDGIVI